MHIKTYFMASTALAGFFVASSAMALTVAAGADGDTLADTLFLNSPGLSNLTVTMSGDSRQFGTFTNTTGTYGLPTTGIALSTGNVADYGDGPNRDSGWTTGFGNQATQEQEDLLDPITGGGFDHNDVAQLTITFDAADDVDMITFFGTFGSEEFPEFVGTEFIDGFGLFVNGKNVAFAGVGNQPININHPDFFGAFIDDGEGGGEGDGNDFPDVDFPDVDFPGDDVPVAASFETEIPSVVVFDETTDIGPRDPRLALVTGTELDGVIAPGGNPVLRFDIPVIPGQTNTFDIIIADTSDDSFDSTIYLSSFQPQEVDLNDGSTEFTPLLPGDLDPNDGVFVFDLGGIPDLGEIFFIDPPVAVGYTYTVTDAEFALIQAPSLATVGDTDGYLISYLDGGTLVEIALGAGATLDVAGAGISEFTLSGIDTSLSLDPNDPLAFPLGISLQNVLASPSVTQTAITMDIAPVPLPASLPLLAFAGLSMFWYGRRRPA